VNQLFFQAAVSRVLEQCVVAGGRQWPTHLCDMHSFAGQTVAELLRDLGAKFTGAADTLG